MRYPKILVISHNCFSQSGSNGRTLANFFIGYPKERLAQFYIYNEIPDSSVCQNYYRVTDKEAVKAIIGGNVGSVIENEIQKSVNEVGAREYKKPKKTPLVYLMRECVWSIGRWKNKKLKTWIESVAPDLILFQAGDAAFLFDFAHELAEKRDIPLVIYNSESYYFKEKNYLTNSLGAKFWYKILHWNFKRCARKSILFSSASIYISDMLQQLYYNEFKKPSYTIMTSTELTGEYNYSKSVDTKITYLGNLGVGRTDTLIELGKILHSIDKKYKINVYGQAPEAVITLLKESIGICYCGFVSYKECVKIMMESTILIHVENFSEFYLEDSKYAFSTKIADSLASGTCLFLYAPKEISCSQYLEEYQAACVANDSKEAYEKLQELLRNEELRNNYAKRGMKIALENHSMENNRKKFWHILMEARERR